MIMFVLVTHTFQHTDIFNKPSVVSPEGMLCKSRGCMHIWSHPLLSNL